MLVEKSADSAGSSIVEVTAQASTEELRGRRHVGRPVGGRSGWRESCDKKLRALDAIYGKN